MLGVPPFSSQRAFPARCQRCRPSLSLLQLPQPTALRLLQLPQPTASSPASCTCAVVDRDGCTPLYCAAAWNRTEAVRLLERLHCPSSLRSLEGRTAVHVAAEQGWVDLIQVLISELGNQVDARDNYQFTPLHSAANGGHVAAIQRLAALQHDLDARDYLGRTPLHYAAMHGRVAALEELVRLGADVGQKDLRGGFTGALEQGRGGPRRCTAVRRCMRHGGVAWLRWLKASKRDALPGSSWLLHTLLTFHRSLSSLLLPRSASPGGGRRAVRRRGQAGGAGRPRRLPQHQGAHPAAAGTHKGAALRATLRLAVLLAGAPSRWADASAAALAAPAPPAAAADSRSPRRCSRPLARLRAGPSLYRNHLRAGGARL
jgi:hypothetical protein